MISLLKTCKAYIELARSVVKQVHDEAGYAALSHQIEQATQTDIIQ